MADLARRASRGDTRAEGRLVEICHPLAVSLAAGKMRDRETAREVANDVMFALLVALRRGVLRDPDKVAAFVYGTTMHLVHNRLRRDRNRPETSSIEVEPGGEDPWIEHERRDQIRQVQRALHQLEPLDRRILTLTLVEGLKPGEIADRVEMPVEVVRQRKCRSLKELVAVLGSPTGSRTGSRPEVPRR